MSDVVQGHCAPGFGRMRDALTTVLTEIGDSGAACAVYRGGRAVVDLFGGVADVASGQPWTSDTIQMVFSATKAVTAVCIHRLAERGALDLDAPVARWWPEFAAAGKAEVPIAYVLSHRAGLPTIDAELTLAEALAWTPVVDALAAQPPAWEPGSVHGYHVRSFGWILGELVRRIDGRTIGRYVADEIAGPLGLDLRIGLAPVDIPRVATLIPPDDGGRGLMRLLGTDSLTTRAMTGPSGLFGYTDVWNRADVRAAELPSSNGIGSAHALARFYAALIGEIDGRRLLSAETVRAATRVVSEGPDRVLLLPSRFGLGFALPPMLGPGPGPRSFGHPGAGGCLAFADLDADIAFGFVSTRMRFDLRGDSRWRVLLDALYASLG